MKNWIIVILFFCIPVLLSAQSKNIDSLLDVLQSQKADSNKVKTLNEIGIAYSQFLPSKAIIYLEEAYNLAVKLKLAEQELKALSLMANTYNSLGNYNKATDISLKQLQVLEKVNNPRRLAIVLMNLAVYYTQQTDYSKALYYYLKSDSVIIKNKILGLNYNISQNLGDLYDRLNKNDSAFFYYGKALTIANTLNDYDFIGASYVGLGNCFAKLNNNQKAIEYYHIALSQLAKVNDNDLYCETTLNLANLFFKEKKYDSALYYGHLNLYTAIKSEFPVRIKDASSFLGTFYKKNSNSDSALFYFEETEKLKDTMNSQEKIKNFQLKTINEEIRQAELAQARRKEMEERSQQLQLLLIGIFIPIFFLLTLLLSSKKIHIRAIKTLGIISLLLFFEYITLLLHPRVVEFTNHTPIYELFIFVAIAALLIPTHHRIENWLIQKLTHKHTQIDENIINIKTNKLNLKKPL